MVIEKLHGLQATGLSLNERFTMLQSGAPDRVAMIKARRRNINMFRDPNINFRNRALIEQIALKLQQQAKRRALRQRMGLAPGALRRFGSESSLPGLWRANSFSNLSFNSQGSKFNQKQANRNIRRWSSSGNLSGGRGRGARGVRGARGRGRGVTRSLRGRLGDGQVQGRVRRTQARGGRPARGRGRGGVMRKQSNKTPPTKEELDLQLDEYMASSKSALDKELDTYMKNAMEFD